MAITLRQTGRTRDPKQGPDRARGRPVAADGDRARLSLSCSSRCRSRGLHRGVPARLGGLSQRPINEPDAIAALTLTLTAAAIAVPANLLFGVCAAWAIGKFQFRGKQLLIDAHRSCRLRSRR